MSSDHDALAVQTYLAEFDKLRSEIDARTGVLPTLLTIELASLGGGLSVATKVPEITLALAMVSSFLWLVWIDQANQVRKIAAYISIELAPRIREHVPRALGWEPFLRRLEAGGDEAYRVLRLDPEAGDGAAWSPGDVGTSTTALFGSTPVLLVATFAFRTEWNLEKNRAFAFILAVAVLAFWFFCVSFYFRLKSASRLISRAIVASDAAP